jgi:hypothetical protein
VAQSPQTDSLWARSDSPARRLAVWALALLLITAFAGALGVLVSSRPNPAEGVRALLNATKSSDEAAYMCMSERYRGAHDLADFRRALARVSEVRSAENLGRPPNIGLLERPERAEFCTNFSGIEGVLRVHTVWENGDWLVDALAVDGSEMDPGFPATVACGPLR